MYGQLLTVNLVNLSPAAGDDSQMAAISEEQTPLKKKGLSKDTVWGEYVSSDDRSRGGSISGSPGLGVAWFRRRSVGLTVCLSVARCGPLARSLRDSQQFSARA